MAIDRPPFPQKPRGPGLSFRDVGHRDLVEMNHRIANSLQLIAGYLMLQAKELAIGPGARSALHFVSQPLHGKRFHDLPSFAVALTEAPKLGCDSCRGCCLWRVDGCQGDLLIYEV